MTHEERVKEKHLKEWYAVKVPKKELPWDKITYYVLFIAIAVAFCLVLLYTSLDATASLQATPKLQGQRIAVLGDVVFYELDGVAYWREVE